MIGSPQGHAAAKRWQYYNSKRNDSQPRRRIGLLVRNFAALATDFRSVTRLLATVIVGARRAAVKRRRWQRLTPLRWQVQQESHNERGHGGDGSHIATVSRAAEPVNCLGGEAGPRGTPNGTR